MKKTAGIVTSICVLLLVGLSSTLRAETLTANVILTPGAEISPSPLPPADAFGNSFITVNVSRDNTGTITSATITFSVSFKFQTGITVTGLHIHEGAVTSNGSVRFDSGLSGSNSLVFTAGQGALELKATSVDLAILQRLLANPAGFYVNLHTRDNPGGAIRGQLVKLTETVANTVAMTGAQEVSPSAPPPANAIASSTVTVNPVRKPTTGEIIGGMVTITADMDLGQNTNLTGLHIHEAVAGMNGSIVIDSGVNGGANAVPMPTGKTTLSIPIRMTTPTQIAAMQRMLANPAGFYVNAHTTLNPGGAVRGQLRSFSSPPVIQRGDRTRLTTGTTTAVLGMFISWFDFGGSIMINGQPVNAVPDLATGQLSVMIPAEMRRSAGTLYVQAQNFLGQRSAPYAVVVAPAFNSFPATTVDSAQYGDWVSPESMATVFGTRLATQTASASTVPLPTTLGGTRVYVNGTAAGLFYVSDTQINYLIPPETITGVGEAVVVAQDGTVSFGDLNVAGSSPSVFTANWSGTGAPAAVASVDGQNFNINLGDSAGNPVAIDVGTYVALFGTGLRYPSTALTPMTVTIGGTGVMPLYLGAQLQFEGLDQVNLQIPQSLAGRGEVDLIISVDGMMSNPVRLKIK